MQSQDGEDPSEAIKESLASFKEGLQRHDDPLKIVREFITHGPCVIIDQAKYAALREDVATALSVSANQDVYVVGSAKLGFSIKPGRRFGFFEDKSDIDVAVVSSNLYGKLWREARAFRASQEPWGESKSSLFLSQHFSGRISPDNLPKASPLVPTVTRLQELGRDLQRRRVAGPYKVTFAVWADMDALESYQAGTVAQCQKVVGK